MKVKYTARTKLFIIILILTFFFICTGSVLFSYLSKSDKINLQFIIMLSAIIILTVICILVSVDLKRTIKKINKEYSEKERMGTELNVAAEIQASMLPCNFPPFPERKEINIFAFMNPAKDVGGDFYDFYFLDKNNFVVVIADVSGKGIPAALFMVITKTLIKNCSMCKTPKAVMESVNRKLCEGNDAAMFVTVFIGFYNIPESRLVYINAGHNPPLIKRKGGLFEYLRSKPSLILGFLENAVYEEHEIELKKGDTLFMYTDGVTEAMTENKVMFGEQRLLKAVNKNKNNNVKQLIQSVKEQIDDFTDGAEQADDVTLMALKICEFDEIVKEAKPENLDGVIEFTYKVLERTEYSQDKKNEITTAVEEIFINISEYAYDHGHGNVKISIDTETDTIITFEDTGKPYNPVEHPNPDLHKSINDRQIGGLGIYLVKNLMDNVEYKRDKNKNILTMVKNRS